MVVEIVPPPVFEVEVHGVPRPQGSKSAFVNQHTGRAQIKEQNASTHAEWRADIVTAARRKLQREPMAVIDGPVETRIEYRFPRPALHFGTGRNAGVLKATAPAYPIGSNIGDIDKLERSVNDALKIAGVWVDDRLVVRSHPEKLYATGPGTVGATIRVFLLKSTITDTDPWPKEEPCNP